MTGGVVQGGWEFVVAAYALTGIVLLLYGVSLWSRLRHEGSNEQSHEQR